MFASLESRIASGRNVVQGPGLRDGMTVVLRPEGSGGLIGFAAQAQKKDKALAKWMQTMLTSFDIKADAATHQVNCIFHFNKPA